LPFAAAPAGRVFASQSSKRQVVVVRKRKVVAKRRLGREKVGG